MQCIHINLPLDRLISMQTFGSSFTPSPNKFREHKDVKYGMPLGMRA